MDRKRVLKQTSRDLRKHFQSVKRTVTNAMMLFLALYVPALLFGLARGFATGWEHQHRVSRIEGAIFAVSIGLITIVPATYLTNRYYSPFLDNIWKRHYARARACLARLSKAGTVIDAALFIGMTRGGKPAGQSQPTTLDELLELVCDYRGTLQALARVIETDGSKYSSPAVKSGIRRSKLSKVLEVFLEDFFTYELPRTQRSRINDIFLQAMLWPVFLPSLAVYIRRQAWRTALVEFLRDTPGHPVPDQ